MSTVQNSTANRPACGRRAQNFGRSGKTPGFEGQSEFSTQSTRFKAIGRGMPADLIDHNIMPVLFHGIWLSGEGRWCWTLTAVPAPQVGSETNQKRPRNLVGSSTSQ